MTRNVSISRYFIGLCVTILVVPGLSHARYAPLSLEFDKIKRLNSDFRIAVRENRLDYAKALIERGADVNSASDRRETALMYATRNCSRKAIEFLLGSKVNVNARDIYGRTALMLAARESCVPGVMMLLKARNIMTNAKDHLGNCAIDYASGGAVVEVDGPAQEILKLFRQNESGFREQILKKNQG